MVKKIALIILFLQPLILFSQGGLNPYAGIVVSTNNDIEVTPEGTAHYGYYIGADARLFGGAAYFIIGGQFVKISLLGEDFPKFFSSEHELTILRGRGGFGFDLIRLKHNLKLRSKLLGSLDYFSLYPAEVISGRPTHKRLNDAVLGITTGAGLDLGGLTVDLEYSFGLINAYFEEPDSKYSSWSIHIGFFF